MRTDSKQATEINPTIQEPAKPKKKVRKLIRLLVIATALFCLYEFQIDGSFHEVIPGRVYRSSQPTGEQLRKEIEKYHLKTVVNLRGPNSPDAKMEEAVCDETGTKLIHVELSAYAAMPKKRLIELIDALETAQRPLLLHCNHGIDRSKTAAGLAAWLYEGKSFTFAKIHAFVLPGPWKYQKGFTHVSDVLGKYETYCREHERDPDDPVFFKEWAFNYYQPDAAESANDDVPVKPAAESTAVQ